MPGATGFKYIVEHMEEGLTKWSELEYLHILQHVGHHRLLLSSLHPNFLPQCPPALRQGAVLCSEAVLDIPALQADRVILLDPASPTPLRPEDGEAFDYLLFGGILGDDPPRDRTSELRKLGFATRHLGPVQMTTDTAVLVAQQVVEQGRALDTLPYVDRPNISLGPKESVEMPFRYLLTEQGKPILPPGMLDLIRAGNDESLM